ncbi:MAG: hypothetical protein ACI8SK_000518 [Shewanella sp.]|jgi:hypothetical protein
MNTNEKIELIEDALLENVSGGREQEFCMNCLSCIQCIFQPD